MNGLRSQLLHVANQCIVCIANTINPTICPFNQVSVIFGSEVKLVEGGDGPDFSQPFLDYDTCEACHSEGVVIFAE